MLTRHACLLSETPEGDKSRASNTLAHWVDLAHLDKIACNARHLALAQKLESAVDRRLEHAAELSENALRNLVSVVSEAAQRISRLALGAATENITPIRPQT